MPAELRRRYDVRGPRYTSYPPATAFGPIELESLLERWRARAGLRDDPGLGLYVHVPFCPRRCLYCGCHTTVSRDEQAMAGYVEAVVAEMDLAAAALDPGRPVRQVSLGGGTPHALPLRSLERLLGAIEARWSPTARAERSVELDPGTVSDEHLGLLLDGRFDRFSLGVQDLDERVRRSVGRTGGLAEVDSVVRRLRARGVDRINFDLIYGLPGQDLGTAEKTVEQVVALRPGRIATYGYAHVPWVSPHQKALEALDLPGPELRVEIFLAWADRLLAAGYVPVGMDHFALPEDPLVRALETGTLRRSFMGYTDGRGLDVAAFGASAISSVGASYSQDDKDLDGYRRAVSAGRLPVVRGHLLSEDDLLRRELIADLFCSFRADLGELSHRVGLDAREALAADLPRLEPLVEDGLVRLEGDRIEVTELGRFFVRNVCMVFDRYLGGEAGAPRFSRTV